ncbi:aminotransferase class I/II-fold pyridoxal phosphate-dependent enzyme [Lederbergia wuyishanensis]|uniref:Arginine/lysine/ornithine decarboxylase n=1 Tax=Lederbergia wuyishanensis TaxID=1347903 RepID=A0ABU0DAQ6_9BACI|nr:aminotransferase class I/II-fold pyridoxal phosphate-dependent enzyme [Lederbergia wuyishanensis]MCJ8009990.1 aminotransferase class I/II-fold pyridoxal phosphate-dependent enzyme [Lederbergia wuyishanensis]MDQ0345503.1 arginine/lysine/ornithine decarboxylase [Lederbergia wuyishanensis]
MQQKNMPLYESLVNHNNKKPISFHVPGHKNGELFEGEIPFRDFAQYDLTELTGLDDLHDPQEAIKKAQDLLTELYRSRKSYFLVNGSTVGNLAMIMATCHEDDTVIVQRNCHKSILNGLMLAKVKPVFFSPDINKDLSIPAGPNQAIIQDAIEKYPHAKVLILTYPDYYGQAYDIKKIIDFAHDHNMIVLVDEAHGAHFQLGNPFPHSSLQQGADIVVHSAHKTLPAMTMGSFLHINSERISEQRVEFYLNVLQSSSPSYPIMASLDFARNYLDNFSKADIDFFIQERDWFIKKLREVSGVTIITSDDPLKIIVRHDSLSGFELQEHLERKGIFPELADPYQVLLILPLVKQGMSFPFEEAIDRFHQLSLQSLNTSKKDNILLKNPVDLIELSYSYKEMLNMPYEWVYIQQSVGRIAAKMIIPYPPGIPLFLPGEKITNEHIIQFQKLIQAGARFQGDTGSEKIAVF